MVEHTFTCYFWVFLEEMSIVQVDKRAVALPHLCRHHAVHQELRQEGRGRVHLSAVRSRAGIPTFFSLTV